MIKLYPREMKLLSRIFTICLCSASLYNAFADGPVATTSGSNLTAFHSSNSYNNQWATLSNGRDNSANSGSAKADFGNCNALISRCAQPKCGNGGCTDLSIAENIVKGCVLSNTTCKKYGDDLISVMAAQLVATSNAKVNTQQAQIAQMQSAQNQQQMQDMQNQMMQMQQNMQNQLAQQNAQTAAAVQDALAAQQAQHEKEMAEMKSAATEAAMKKESGLTAYEEQAIANGATAELLDRKRITGEIITKIENAEDSMKAVETAMREAFKYAQCDNRGNSCVGPKRVRKFREIATKFSEPYDNVVEQIYDALDDAQMVGGIELGDIMMMLDNSCQHWAQYLCQPGSIEYTTDENGNKVAPLSCNFPTNPDDDLCKDGVAEVVEIKKELIGITTNNEPLGSTTVSVPKLQFGTVAVTSAKKKLECRHKYYCKPCSKIKNLTSKDEVFTGWVETEYDSSEPQKVVACADSAITNNKMLGRRAKSRNGAGLVDPDIMADWLSQTEPSRLSTDVDGKYNDEKGKAVIKKYCAVEEKNKTLLRRAVASKSVPQCTSNSATDCICKKPETPSLAIQTEDGVCTEGINPLYALCDTHIYNVGELTNTVDDTTRADMKEVIALKTTVITQQLYKQYEYLKATLRRLQVMLEKAVYTSTLEAAGAKTESGSSSSGSSSGSEKSKDKTLHVSGAMNCSSQQDLELFGNCIASNASLIVTHAEDNDKSKACKQLLSDLRTVNSRLSIEGVLYNAANPNGLQWSACKVYLDEETVDCSPKGENGCGADGKKKQIQVPYVVKSGCDGDMKKRDTIRACANEMSSAVGVAKRKVKNQGVSLRDVLLGN
ncbi:MAG: hypothetical protein IKN73_00755 [Alphaproteobacteria bacterium]|nr:hypothetical protein [Alphaproteobacteria bacterium]